MLGAPTFFSMRDIPVVCSEREYARFPPPPDQTCATYLAPFLGVTPGYVNDPNSTTLCEYCGTSDL